MSDTIHLVPCYGRDYKSKKAVEESLGKGEDFRIADLSNPFDGLAVNFEQLGEYRFAQVRYQGLRKVTMIHLGKLRTKVTGQAQPRDIRDGNEGM